MASDTYKRYLESDRWKKKRQQAIDHAGGKCTRCGADGVLHVHHKVYANLGNEPLTDLEVLCVECHGVADKLREVEDGLESENISPKIRLGFLWWMVKGYGWDWGDDLSAREIIRQAHRFLSRIKIDDPSNSLIARTIGIPYITTLLMASELNSVLSPEEQAQGNSLLERFQQKRAKEIDRRTVLGILARYHLDDEIAGCDFRLQAAGVSYKRFRIEFNGPTAGQPVLVKEWNPHESR